jgi:hypothetical protein
MRYARVYQVGRAVREDLEGSSRGHSSLSLSPLSLSSLSLLSLPLDLGATVGAFAGESRVGKQRIARAEREGDKETERRERERREREERGERRERARKRGGGGGLEREMAKM